MLFFDFWFVFMLSMFGFFFILISLFVQLRNFLMFLIYNEILYLWVSFYFILFSFIQANFLGGMFSFWIIALATSEATLGFMIIILLFNCQGETSFNKLQSSRG
jgi:NADH:ubiquinone oxidoreductase subunit K